MPLRLDEQAVESAGLGEFVEARIAGPFEECAVGIEQRVQPIDKNADRQPLEDGAALLGVACGIAAAGDPRGRNGCNDRLLDRKSVV